MDKSTLNLIRLQEELLACSGSDGKMRASMLLFERLVRDASAGRPTLFFQAMPTMPIQRDAMAMAQAIRDPEGPGVFHFYNGVAVRKTARGVVLASSREARHGWEIELHSKGYISLTDFNFGDAPADRIERIEVLGKLCNQLLSSDQPGSGYLLRCRIFDAEPLGARHPHEIDLPELHWTLGTPFGRATDHLANLIRAELGLAFAPSNYP